MRIPLFIALTLLLAGGCTRVLPVDHKAVVVDYNAAHRGSYIFSLPNDKYAIISEPPPDVAKEITSSLGVSAESIGEIAGGEAKLEYASKVIDLARRSQTLQVLREALFRLAEMGVSADLENEERIAMFQSVVRLVRELGVAELKHARAEEKRETAAEHKAFRDLLNSSTLSDEQRDTLILRHLGGNVREMDLTDDSGPDDADQ